MLGDCDFKKEYNEEFRYFDLFHFFAHNLVDGAAQLCRLRSTDVIVKNLIVANLLVLLSSGIHYTMSHFEWHHFLKDFGCRFFPYVRAVGRGVSIGTTCLLSVFQAIMISPRNSKWAELKVKALKCIVPSIFFCWILQMLVNVIYPTFMSWNNKNITNRKTFRHCSAARHDKTRDSLYAALLSFPDVFCLLLMVWASVSMVLTLHRHKQRVQHIHRTNISSRSSPESRATQTILLLKISRHELGVTFLEKHQYTSTL
ncbi:hypothetical protein HPG69_013984 [Diceros bicornis minor]|uniref:Vomeronasal type-1 receptor n=1 Tax=Diceros bicornis minor TaxID=77932 RepID=A0A7J7EMN2_DICBM|nr:hypothetical protein HPG69_013984 [Diceros bicornis minor]